MLINNLFFLCLIAHLGHVLIIICNVKQLLIQIQIQMAWGEVGRSIMTINQIQAGAQEPCQLKHVP